jgi:hypothetical protein
MKKMTIVIEVPDWYADSSLGARGVADVIASTYNHTVDPENPPLKVISAQWGTGKKTTAIRDRVVDL